MATVVLINRLQLADGKRDALIGLLREFAESAGDTPDKVAQALSEVHHLLPISPSRRYSA
jgi:hypothetical protein